jgi:hypothetical protein
VDLIPLDQIFEDRTQCSLEHNGNFGHAQVCTAVGNEHDRVRCIGRDFRLDRRGVQLLRGQSPNSAHAVRARAARQARPPARVVGPFYLSRGLGLETALVGLALSAGPLVAALTGVPAGRIVDRFGAQRMTIIGLVGIAVGSSVLSMMPASFGVAGYIAPIVLLPQAMRCSRRPTTPSS